MSKTTLYTFGLAVVAGALGTMLAGYVMNKLYDSVDVITTASDGFDK